MNLLPIAKLLAQEGLGKLGEDIFMNMIPISATRGVLLRNPLVGTRIDYEMPGYKNTEFQIIVRAPSYDQGETLMGRVFEALTLDATQLEGLFVQRCYPTFEPVVYPLSDGNLLEFATDFRIICHGT